VQSGHAISQKGMSDVQNEPKHQREMKEKDTNQHLVVIVYTFNTKER